MAKLHASISTLRVTDGRASLDFFEKLGFKTVWEHQDSADAPLFVEIRRDDVSFFLSEHQGDGPEQVRIYICVDDAPGLHAQFSENGIADLPEPYVAEWGHWVFSMEDLDANTMTFGSPAQT